MRIFDGADASHAPASERYRLGMLPRIRKEMSLKDAGKTFVQPTA
jgi:hypothetical protein